MAEPGGPTAQAGIRFQNSVAAMYLGELLRWDLPAPRDRVIEVRLEAPTHVDDIVVRHADGHRDWIQVKLALEARGKAWSKLWADFARQLIDDQFGSGDRLRLVLGSASALASNLVALAERAQFGDAKEWRARLSAPQQKLASLIGELVSDPYKVFARLTVETIEADRLERDFAPYRLPSSSIEKSGLLTMLRDLAGGDARIRGIFSGARLRDLLYSQHGVTIAAPDGWGLDVYLAALETLAHISVPGTASGGSCGDLFIWPDAVASDVQRSQIEDEFGARERPADVAALDLAAFPSPEHDRLIVHAGPGFGKSTLLKALSARLARSGRVPAIVPLASLVSSGKDTLSYLSSILNAEMHVRIDWEQLTEDGTAVLLFDGLDEVATEDRPSLVRQLQTFAARFPNAPWLLTVRDPAVIPAGFDAPKYELLPLSDAGLKSFSRAWRPDLSENRIESLLDEIDAHPDLASLVRIPLFLTLLLATWDAELTLPTGRADLIENYLTTLFRPDQHKDVGRVGDPERLREAMQALSFDLLEEGKIGTSERHVRKLVANHAGRSVPAEQLYDDALRCGLLQRQGGGRLAFPFPIVQEYLAACRLLEHHRDEIGVRAERSIERPWAQTIQFALEGLPDATAIAKTLLAKKDDAFASTTRLLARCLANGMKSDSDVVEKVGRRLVEAWPRASFWTAKRIGQLLLERWSNAPSPALLKALHNKYLIHDGAGAILARLDNSELTLSVLEAHLADDISPNIGPLQPLVTAQSDRAFEIYLQRARKLQRDTDQLWALSSLISRLDAEVIGVDRLTEVALSPAWPDMIRLATCEILEAPLPSDFWDMIERGLRSRDYHRRWAARDALGCVPDRETHILAYLGSKKMPAAARADILDDLPTLLGPPERCLAFARTAVGRSELDRATSIKVRLWAAILGDRNEFEALIGMLPRLSMDNSAVLAETLSEYRDREDGVRLVGAFEQRKLRPAYRVKIAAALLMGTRYKFTRHGLRSAALDAAPPHPASDLVLALIERWSDTADFERLDALEMTTVAADAGLQGATDRLLAITIEVIEQEAVGGHDSPLNYPVRRALDILQAKGRPLPLETVARLVETAGSNARLGAISMLGSIGTNAALDTLLELSRSEKTDWSSIFQSAEKLAARLNVEVVRTPRGLARSSELPVK